MFLLKVYAFNSYLRINLSYHKTLPTSKSITDIQYSSSINGISFGIKVHVISDNSGYYIIGLSINPIIWKYIFSSGSSQCQTVSLITTFAYAQLMLSDSQFFFIGVEGGALPPLHLVKITFGGSSTNWANR